MNTPHHDSRIEQSAQQALIDAGAAPTKASLAGVPPDPEVRRVAGRARRDRKPGDAGRAAKSHADADVLAVAPVPLPGDADGEVDGGTDLLHAAKLTVPEGAKAFGIGETKLRGMIQRGELPILLVGNKVRLLARDLESYLRRHYGAMSPAPKTTSALPELPDSVLNSDLMQHIR